MQSFGFF